MRPPGASLPNAGAARAALCAALLCLDGSGLAARGQQPLPQPAFRADDFVDFVGINGSPLRTRVYADGPFKGMGATHAPEVFYDLGIRHYRFVLRYDLTLPDQPEQVRAAWEKSGARPTFLIDPGKTKTAEAVVAELKRYAPGSVEGIEGPNECNNKFPPQELNLRYAGKTDEAAGAAFMDDVYRAAKADPETRNLQVIAFDAIFTDYSLARPHAAFDFANMHSYQGYNVPSSSLLMNETGANNLLPAGAAIRPFMPTECGYNVEADKSNGTLKTGSLRAQALNIPMLLAEYFRHGIARAYLFGIQNADGYGLLEDDLKTLRPSYRALKGLLDALRDAAWNPATLRWEGPAFSPRALLFSLDGAPPTVHALTLQKADGSYRLLLWDEVRTFDSDARRDLFPPPVPIAVRFAVPMEAAARVSTQDEQGNREETAAEVRNGELRLAVGAAVTIVRLRTASAAASGVLPAPAGLGGSATENEVRLAWSPVPGAAGYFVFRNGGHVATTTQAAFDDASAWIRPGLGYRYAVQAYDAAGTMSPRAEAVVQTPDRKPDLVCVGLRTVPDAPRPGDPVRFQAVVRNAGDGATPSETEVGASFRVDGKFVSWGVEKVVLAPGEEHVFAANGGPAGSATWTAAAGTHVVAVELDDVRRVVPERDKFNNLFDATLVVEPSPSGLLRGRSEPAPGEADLSREGSLDWVAWGEKGAAGLVRKAGAGLIGPLEESGTGHLDATGGCPVALRWDDGDAPARASGIHAGLWWNGVGHACAFTVPADTRERALRVYVAGIEGASGRLSASLSDGSAPDYVSDTWSGNLSRRDWAAVPGGFGAAYLVRYRAASPGQTLRVAWTLAGEPNRFRGQARLQAAALSFAEGGAEADRPPP